MIRCLHSTLISLGILDQHVLEHTHSSNPAAALCSTDELCCCVPQVVLYRYDGEEWLNVISRDNELVSMGWTKEETDYLLDMLEQFDLRFIVVADRYNVRYKQQQWRQWLCLLCSRQQQQYQWR
eukprot:GHUV01038756.1.p1 GENE.GHUV01038756.1~~GHUV01038756.1.p1  ORF type:complete len:124 (-),score=39.18 GHUV01038756.1:61-432(-)